ncbi:hypothetical protein Leryth_025438, partial [Lithospermum erythrorhizon]
HPSPPNPPTLPTTILNTSIDTHPHRFSEFSQLKVNFSHGSLNLFIIYVEFRPN